MLPTSMPTETRSVQVGGVSALQESFDGLPMDSAMPEPWTVTGHQVARIVALPTSVDRSARLESGEDGAATVACLPLRTAGTPEPTIVLEYQLSPRLVAPVTLLTLESGGSRKVTLDVDRVGVPTSVTGPGGAIGETGPPATASPTDVVPATQRWHHVELTIAMVSGEVTWAASDSSSEQMRSGWGTAGELGDAGIDSLCIHSPAGLASAWVAIDDLVVRG
jgi:hypothetical protein